MVFTVEGVVRPAIVRRWVVAVSLILLLFGNRCRDSNSIKIWAPRDVFAVIGFVRECLRSLSKGQRRVFRTQPGVPPHPPGGPAIVPSAHPNADDAGRSGFVASGVKPSEKPHCAFFIRGSKRRQRGLRLDKHNFTCPSDEHAYSVGLRTRE